ncbi:putative REJ domain-containing protein 2, partial [Homarus americanus]
GVCTDYCSDELKYAWSISTLVNGVKSLITDGTSYMIGHDKPKVVIQKTLFIDHPTVLEFHIKQIISRLVDNEGGVGTMVLKINKPPGGGTCTLTPPPGRVFIEENTIIDPET